MKIFKIIHYRFYHLLYSRGIINIRINIKNYSSNNSFIWFNIGISRILQQLKTGKFY